MKLRFARHTNDLKRIIEFYTKTLNFEILGEFKNHSNYDGVFLGKQDLDWHLEFTTSTKNIIHSFVEDDLIALYSDSKAEYDAILKSLTLNNISFIKAENPYWNLNGKMFLDPDGFRIVLVNLN
ncbi:MAG: VOC family protein [Bacteroidota bacterium]